MPNSSKPIIFLAFSNDEHRPLSSLAAERIALLQILQPLVNQGDCELIIEAAATLEDIFRVFSHKKNRHRVAIFHYAGHASGNGLHTIHMNGGNQTAHASGLAKFFGMQQNLKLVFLNGCSTREQVALLQFQNIPNIIATSQSIKDTVAKMMAEKFYETFAQGEGIGDAFKVAEAFVEAEEGAGNYRRISPDFEEEEEAIPWKAYFEEENWRLTSFYPLDDPFTVFLAYSERDKEQKDNLLRQLAVLKRRRMIDVIDKTGVQPGDNINQKTLKLLNNANIVLLFVTENLFFDAPELIDEAVERYERKAITLIPVYIRRCLIKGEKFAELEPLPRRQIHNGEVLQFVSDWDNPDRAYYEIALGLRNLIEALKQENM